MIIPEIYPYIANIKFLKALIRINPAYICCAPEIIINDKKILEDVATVEPMSIVYLLKTNCIKKEGFIEMIRHNPAVLQNYWAHGGIPDEEMINAGLYQIRDVNKKYKKFREAYYCAQACVADMIEEPGTNVVAMEPGVISFTREQIEYIAKFALGYDLDRLVPNRKALLELLKKYPQAVRAVSEEKLISSDGSSYTEEDFMLCSDGRMRPFFGDIRELFEKNPDIEKFYLMGNDEFEEYMDSYIIEQRNEMGILTRDDTAEREAAIRRITEKSAELQKLREVNRESTRNI